MRGRGRAQVLPRDVEHEGLPERGAPHSDSAGRCCSALRESYCGQIGYEVSAARHSSAELLRTLIQTCRVFDVSMVQPVACHWVSSMLGHCQWPGLRAALCACSTCTSRTASAATGSGSALRLPRRCAPSTFHLLYPPPPILNLAPAQPLRLGKATACEPCTTLKRRRRGVSACSD